MSKNQFAAVVVSATALLGFLAYANTFTGDWVWDDVSSVLLHEHVHEPGKFFQLFAEDQHAFGRGQGNFYRPLVSASFMLDFWLSYDAELDAAGTRAKGYPDVKPLLFHLTNILWHVAAAVLLFFLLVRLQAPRIIQAVTPMLYVLHPMHTEAVAYISGRADMMSAVFILAALLVASSDGKRGRLVSTLGSAFLFALGLCSKESTMIYPVLLGLAVLIRPQADGSVPTKETWKARSMPLAAAVVVLVVYGLLRATVLKFGGGGGGAESGLFTRLGETGQAFTFYIKTLLVPSGLHMEQTLAGTPAWTGFLGVVLIAAVLGALFLAFKLGNRRIALGFAWFLAAWLPISGIFPLNAPMAEHWMYVPMAGFWWAVLELLLLAAKRTGMRLLVPGVATLLAMVFLYTTVSRNQDWQNNERIFRATLAENPDTMRVHFNLATTYDLLEGNLPGARRHYEEVLDLYARDKQEERQLLPEEIPVRLALAEVLLRQGAYQESARQFGLLLSLEGQDAYKSAAASAYLGTAQSLVGLGNYSQAVPLIQKATALDPSLSRAANSLLRGAPLPARR